MKRLYDTPMPDDWQEKPLAQMVKLKRGYTWTKENEIEIPEDGAVPVIRIPNIQERLDLSNLLYLREVSSDALEKAAITKGWILFVGSNGSQDRIGDSVLMEEDRAMVFASFLMGMTSKNDVELLPDFLANWLRIHLVHECFSKTSQQTTGLANFSWSAVKKLPLRFPTDIKEQRRIAAALKLADNAIAKAKAVLEATRDLKRSLMSELFYKGIRSNDRPMQETKVGPVPADWTVSEIRSFWASSANGLYVPEDRYGSGVPIIRIDTFHDGYFTNHEFKRIRVKPEEVEAYSVQTGDLLINRVNSIPFLGKVVFVDEIAEFTVFESNMMRLRFETIEIAQYLALYLSVPAVKKRIWAMGRPAVAQLSINQRDVGKFLVALPGKNEREEIIGAIVAAKDAETAAGEKLTAFEVVKKSLLQNLLTGKIRIPEGVIHD